MNQLKNFLFEYDNTALNVQDNYQISEKKEVSEYLYGSCHIFAIVLHEYLGLPIEAIIDEEPYHDTMGLPSLEHTYCIINDTYVIDARGIRSKDEVLKEYSSNANQPVKIPNCLKLLKKWIKDGNLTPTTKKEIKDIELYIDSMIANKIFAVAPENCDDISIIEHLISVLPDTKIHSETKSLNEKAKRIKIK